jgi:hypothetical protein
MGYTQLAATLAISLLAAQATTTTLRLPVGGALGQATVCLRPTGEMVGGKVSCRSDAPRRLTCQCPSAALPVVVPVCGPGEPSALSLPAASGARHEGTVRGTLVGVKFRGRAFCVRSDHLPTGRDPGGNAGLDAVRPQVWFPPQ